MANVQAALLSEGDTIRVPAIPDILHNERTVATVETFVDEGDPGVQVTFEGGLVQLYDAREWLPLVSTYVEREQAGR